MNELLNMPPVELLNFLSDNFLGTEIPREINTPDEMGEAATAMAELTNKLSYLNELGAFASVYKRTTKHAGNKEAYEDMIEREKIINTVSDIVSQQYKAYSRILAVKHDINQELYMTGCK